MKVLGAVLAIFVAFVSIACSRSPDLAPRATQSVPGSGSSAYAEGVPGTGHESYLEKAAKDIAVRKDEMGHLFVEGRASVQLARLITYFNVEARSKRNEGAPLFYKVSGLYSGAPDASGYNDALAYRIQVSSDDFLVPVDLVSLTKELGLTIDSRGNLNASALESYTALNALLMYRNAEAANSGREYKIKAWHEKYEYDGAFVRDRVDIMIHFSFDDKIVRLSDDLAVNARSLSQVEERQKAIIAMVAVDFSQLLEKSGELNIVVLDFSGDNEHGPETAYVFEGKDIEKLKKVQDGQAALDKIEILSLAEVKDLRRSYIAGVSLVERSELPKTDAPRKNEPVGPEAAKIAAYIAQESARVINPTSLEIVIYEFAGNAPTKLITWSYMFDSEDIKVLKDTELGAKDILKMATVSEQIGVIPGDRTIPLFKPIIR